jgi:hypothetical protein
MSCLKLLHHFYHAISASVASRERDSAQQARFAIPREILMHSEMEELCDPPAGKARPVPTRMVMPRFAPAQQPLKGARIEVRLVEVRQEKRSEPLATRGFAIGHHLRQVLR